jgi:glycine dehydrogenase subunit 1
MPFIPHTPADIEAMLARIGVAKIDDLFDEIPRDLLSRGLPKVPPGLPEMAITRLMTERAEQDGRYLNFIGAGAYEHHIPAAVWQIVTRGEFYSAYTPYQAEASQGTLQLLYEYQSMMASLTALGVSNASLYDGASGLAEAILMAVRAHKVSRRVLIASTLHPIYRRASSSIVRNQSIELQDLTYCTERGLVLPESLDRAAGSAFAALVVQQPNFFGVLEDVDALTDWAHRQGALVIAVVNPLSLGLLKPPGEWGEKGADIAVGEGQPLGVPLAGGGPYFGFMCCRQELVRQMPGRIVGGTVDVDGKRGYTLTLQAREQHIRRSKATSNICTNQGLAVAAATVYMAMLGPHGLRQAALVSYQNTQALAERLLAVEGVERSFSGANFHEFVFHTRLPAHQVLDALTQRGVLGGVDLGNYYPEFPDAILACATETKIEQDLDRYAAALRDILTEL